jgi:hypothetical protein
VDEEKYIYIYICMYIDKPREYRIEAGINSCPVPEKQSK